MSTTGTEAATSATVTLPSACPLDCPDTCSLDVTVEGGRVTKVEGSHRNPLTDGFICAKVGRFADHLYGPERLLYPLRRTGPKGAGQFERISWDQALDLIAERMRRTVAEHGGEAVLPFSYGGSNGSLTHGATDFRLFHRLGASRLAHTVCAAATGRAAAGLYGKMPGVALEDFVHARLIVLWGVNPSASGIHLVPIVQQARKQGAKVVVIDPRRIPLAKQADLHLAPRPGTDLPLALSVIRWLFASGRADLNFLNAHAAQVETLHRRSANWTFERAAEVCGIPAAGLEAFANLYAASQPAVIRCGWGLERNRNGGSAVAAVLALPAVAGKFGVRGGGYTMSNSGAWRFGDTVQAQAPASRELNMNRLGRDLLGAQPAVHLLFVYNCNPLATLPEQQQVRAGLERQDLFTVVFEQVMTDTARYADVVLPATTFLEHREVRRGYGAMVLQDAAPVIPPVGEARPNYQVFADLLRRLDLHQPGDAESPDELADALLGGSGHGDQLRSQLAGRGIATPECGPNPVQFVDVFPRTPDSKVQLVPPDLDREAPHGLYTYQPDPGSEPFPLALISPASRHTVSSTFGQLLRGPVPLELNPTDAAGRGITSGNQVRVYNDLGEVRCQVRLNPDLRSGVALMPKGIWCRHTANGATSNTLVPATYTDLGQGACFNDARVEVERI